MQRLWEGLRAWLGLLNSESETFSGEALLTRMESLQALSELVSGLALHQLFQHSVNEGHSIFQNELSMVVIPLTSRQPL